jgi:hypothetical protein
MFSAAQRIGVEWRGMALPDSADPKKADARILRRSLAPRYSTAAFDAMLNACATIEREGGCGFRVESSRVGQRDRSILGLNKQADLGTAENDALGTHLDQLGDDLCEAAPRRFRDDAPAGLVIDDVMHQVA